MRAWLNRIARSVVVAGAFTLALVVPAAAREPVDPNTLNPPPPAEFNPVCERLGGGIVCDLAFSDPPVVDVPVGDFCGIELLISEARSVVGKRFYDADGNLLERHFRESWVRTLANPANGKSLDWVGHDTIIHRLAVPGDASTGILTVSGTPNRLSIPGGGTVLVDAGRLVVDVATDTVTRSGGRNHFDDYFIHGDVDALQPLCDALA
jgi:hypothetical protein